MREQSINGRRRPAAPGRVTWTIVQRREEDRAVSVVAEHRWSVALVGAPGLGKTSTAARVTDRVARRDASGRTVVVPITAVASGRTMPFSAVADRFGDLPAGLADLVDDAGAAQRLREVDDLSDRDVVLRVDDADHLDAVSARYVAWLVRDQGARLVLTCRDFTALPEALRALWQDDLLERIDLAPLDLHETGEVVARALGAQLETASTERVHRATAGNPLYLREVVRAALASGALEQTASGWYWRGRITASNSLADMYRTELGALPEDLRDVVDIVALADPIPLARLLGMVSGGDVDRVVALGLVAVDSTEDGTTVVRPSHPLVGEVVRGLVPVARRTTLFARANAFRTTRPEGAPPAARLRAALWSLECGVLPPVGQLIDATQVAVRLQEHESGVTLASAALRTALTATERVTVHCLRSLAHSYSTGREAGRCDAEAAWGIATGRSTEVDDAAIVEACETLANIRQFHDDDVDAAVALTDAAMPLVDAATAERLRLLRLAHLGWGGRFTEVRAEIERSRVLEQPTVPVSFLCVAPCAVTALATAGRLEDATVLAKRSLATAVEHVEEAPWSVGEIVSVLHQVQVWRGDIADLLTEIPVRRSSPFLKYDFTLELIGVGNQAIGQRRWADAVTAFSAACERYDVADHGGFAAYPWARWHCRWRTPATPRVRPRRSSAPGHPAPGDADPRRAGRGLDRVGGVRPRQPGRAPARRRDHRAVDGERGVVARHVRPDAALRVRHGDRARHLGVARTDARCRRPRRRSPRARDRRVRGRRPVRGPRADHRRAGRPGFARHGRLGRARAPAADEPGARGRRARRERAEQPAHRGDARPVGPDDRRAHVAGVREVGRARAVRAGRDARRTAALRPLTAGRRSTPVRNHVVDHARTLQSAPRLAGTVDRRRHMSRTFDPVAGFGPVRVGSESRRHPRYAGARVHHIGRTYLPRSDPPRSASRAPSVGPRASGGRAGVRQSYGRAGTPPGPLVTRTH